jgi:hypothetical protein
MVLRDSAGCCDSDVTELEHVTITSMTATLSLASLRAIKNSIIGNPSRKTELARDGSISLSVSGNPLSLAMG